MLQDVLNEKSLVYSRQQGQGIKSLREQQSFVLPE